MHAWLKYATCMCICMYDQSLLDDFSSYVVTFLFSYVNNIIIAKEFNIDLNSDSSKIFELLIRFTGITTY